MPASSPSTSWKKHSFKNSYSTPVFINLDGEEQMVTFMAKEIVGVDPKNGDLKWRYEHGNQWGQNVCQPIWNAANHVLFFSSPEAGARGVKLTKAGDKTEVEQLWSTKKIQFYHVTSVGLGDYVFGSTGTMGPSFFAAVNVKDGNIAWRERDFAKATCVYADGRFIILDENGELGLASATPEAFSVHSKVKLLDKSAWTVPTVVGKTLFARDKKNILALDLG
jgi:outer membrane protein assembly factor BamB